MELVVKWVFFWGRGSRPFISCGNAPHPKRRFKIIAWTPLEILHIMGLSNTDHEPLLLLIIIKIIGFKTDMKPLIFQ